MKIKSMVKMASIILLATLFAADAVKAAELCRNDFSKALPATLKAVGIEGDGFSYVDNDWKLRNPQVYDEPIALAGLPQGSISFDLKRKVEAANDRFRTIFQIRDVSGGKVLTFQIKWDAGIEPTRPMINLMGTSEYAQSAFTHFGYKHLLDKEVLEGQWIHLDIAWDDLAREYEIYLDGRKQDTRPKYYEYELGKIIYVSEPPDGERKTGWRQADFSDLINDGALIRYGINYTKGREEGTSPLSNGVLDNFVIRSGKFDGIPPEAVERILAETSWADEVRVSWTPSISNDVVGYEIFRGMGEAPDVSGAPLATVAAQDFTDTDVIAGIGYFYHVKAIDGFGNRSAPSEVISQFPTLGDDALISVVAVDPAGKPLRPGETLTVTAKGTSGASASLELLGLASGIDLIEEGATGTYKGNYTVTDKDLLEERGTYYPVVTLSDSFGTNRLAGELVRVVSLDDMNDHTPPDIASVSHNSFAVRGFSGKLVAGDILEVTLKGEAESFARFKVEGVDGSFPMAESTPGTYIGSYKVNFDDEGEGLAVTGYLSDYAGNEARQGAKTTIDLDTRVRMVVTAKAPLLPADSRSKTKVTVRAEDANGDEVPDHELALTLSTTSEYTGVVGGGKVEDKFASVDDEDDLEIRWDGITDSFGEIAATYTAGFAAKTAFIVAKDLTTGDVGAGWLNTYVASTISIELTERLARLTSLPSIRMSAEPGWLTADGRSKSRIRAWLTDGSGMPMEGEKITFTLAGDNGTIRLKGGVTDETGMAEADYRAGTVAGFVTITASAPSQDVTQSIQMELRADAPAKIDLVATLTSMVADGRSTSDIIATVSDINDNPSKKTTVYFTILEGEGALAKSLTDTDEEGVARSTYTAGREAGQVVIEARHTSRAPTEEELRRIYGTIFIPRLYEGQERDRMKIAEWLVENGDKVVKGDSLVTLEAAGFTHTLTAPEDGTFVRKLRFKRDRVELGETIGYLDIAEEGYLVRYSK